MEYPLKIKILQFLIKKLDDAQSLTAPVLILDFSLQEIESFTSEYKPSISREIRSLKEIKAISYICMNKRLGMYRMLFDKSGNKSAKSAQTRLQTRMNKMMDSKRSEIWQTKRLLHDAAGSISEMFTKSEIIQS
jgi:hypothetical protein